MLPTSRVFQHIVQLELDHIHPPGLWIDEDKFEDRKCNRNRWQEEDCYKDVFLSETKVKLPQQRERDEQN